MVGRGSRAGGHRTARTSGRAGGGPWGGAGERLGIWPRGREVRGRKSPDGPGRHRPAKDLGLYVVSQGSGDAVEVVVVLGIGEMGGCVRTREADWS